MSRGRAHSGPLIIAAAVLLSSCTFSPLETPTPTPSISPSPPATASPTARPTSTPSSVPTPDPAAIPDFDAGEIVTTAIDGLRVRTGPGLERPISTGLLPLAFDLRVVLGPVPVDDLGWYLVADADAREPNFGEGWVAAGYEPDPLLSSSGRVDPDAPSVASMAQTGDAEQGPIRIGEGDHAVRWVAVDPERTRCSFAVSVARSGGGDPIPAIRATVGNGVDRGTLQPQSFAGLGVTGDIFVMVVSDCAWALVIERVVPQPTPSSSSEA